VALHNVNPEMETALPTNVFTSSGVNTDAMIVDKDVRMTDSATSALAINATKFDAVPPGQHPTRTNPKNAAGYCGNKVADPMKNAVRGMIRYWQDSPAGIAANDASSPSDLLFFNIRVKSSVLSVIPIAIML
jgi:hypothetical protein